MNKLKLLAPSLLLLTAAPHAAAEAPIREISQPVQVSADKKSLIDEIVPQEIQQIASVGQEVLGYYTGIKEAITAIQTLDFIAKAFGIMQPDMGPSIAELFQQLTKHLDEIAGALDWKISNTARAERYGKVMSAYFGTMHAMAAGEATAAILANADSNSSAALFEVEDPNLTAFMRVYNPEVTSGLWSENFIDRPELVDGQVYDWRLGIPEFQQYLAIRLQIISVIDPSWKVDGAFRSELLKHREFMAQQFDKILGGLRCYYFGDDAPLSTQICADIHSGIYATDQLDNPALSQNSRWIVWSKLPLFDLLAMANTLFVYANPELEETTDQSQIIVTDWHSQELGCLEGGAEDGSEVTFAACDESRPASQHWHFDRSLSRIYNSEYDKCIDIRAGSVADRTLLQVYSCNDGHAQRWTYDAETKLFVSALGSWLGAYDGVHAVSEYNEQTKATAVLR